MLRSEADIPCAKKFKSDYLSPKFTELWGQVQDTLSNCLAVSLSFDLWSKHRNSYMSVTAYVVDQEFHRNIVSLGVFLFNEAHTAQKNAEKLLSIVAQYHQSLPEKVFGVTHDAASNNTGKQFVQAVPWDIRICCWAHKASNAAKRLFAEDSDAQRVLVCAKKLTRAFGQQHAWNALKKAQQGKTVVLPRFSDTRFNGGYIVFSSLLQQQSNIETALDELKTEHPTTYTQLTKPMHGKPYSCIPTRADWAVIEDLVRALELLQSFIVSLQCANLTLSDALMRYRVLMYQLQKASIKTTFHVQLIELLKQYFQDVEDPESIFSVAFALDPRVKKDAVSDKTWTCIANAILSEAPDSRPPEVPSQQTEADDDELQAAMMGITKQALQTQTPAVNTGVLAQISTFRQATPAGMSSSFEACWNTDHAKRFMPLLRQYAAQFFSLQATEVENEREFSSTGKVVFFSF